jgi:hypothetical protein
MALLSQFKAKEEAILFQSGHSFPLHYLIRLVPKKEVRKTRRFFGEKSLLRRSNVLLQ